MAPEETYDWEVRDALRAWGDADPGGLPVIGLAIGEKQMYRGAALALAETLTAAREAGSAQIPDNAG